MISKGAGCRIEMASQTSVKADGHQPERILFVTGRLAEFALRRVLESLGSQVKMDYEIQELGISVAALMHADWVARKLTLEKKYDRVILPGWCQGELEVLESQFQTLFERGPKDLYDLPQFLGQGERKSVSLEEYQIEILAEINHAPQLKEAELFRLAEHYRKSGADVIDLGCVPGESWAKAGEITRRLRDAGHRVSIDSFDRPEVEAAVENGAELVLSVNGTNREWAADLDSELVVIPDNPRDLSTMKDTSHFLQDKGCRFRIDPVLEPIGFGFAASLARYYEARRNWPDCEILMGVGNITELTEVDSAGVNVLLAALCEELSIRSILTTEVINWSRSAVREFDLARRLVHYALKNRQLPKHLDSSFGMLRDPRLPQRTEEELVRLAASLTDPNFRIFAEGDQIHVMNREGYWKGTDAFELFDRFAEASPLDASHAFYLGYELAKAVTALTLGKQYTQDQALAWGFLTVPEISAHERRRGEGEKGRGGETGE
jgi:dihydropteroate synthase